MEKPITFTPRGIQFQSGVGGVTDIESNFQLFVTPQLVAASRDPGQNMTSVPFMGHVKTSHFA